MKNYIETGLACIVGLLMMCNVGCTTSTTTIPAPTAADQQVANQQAKDAATDAVMMYKARLKAEFCKP